MKYLNGLTVEKPLKELTYDELTEIDLSTCSQNQVQIISDLLKEKYDDTFLKY